VYLQRERNLTLQKFAESGANTVVVPANMQGFNMILPADKSANRPDGKQHGAQRQSP
jgi:hypothetical protein